MSRKLGMSQNLHEYFNFIDGYITENGYSPRLKDIAEQFDTPITNARRYVAQLKERGLIDFEAGKKQSIIIVREN